MKKNNKKYNRYDILILLVLVLMIILTFRLATLTIVKGGYYRDLSNNKRLKEIEVTGPRGEIRDRYGTLLAGNKPSFTLQISKDELNIIDKDRKNEIFIELIRLLEEDGVTYIDNFPMDLNTFKYESDPQDEEDIAIASERIVNIIIENNLIHEILSSPLFEGEYEDHFIFSIIDKALYILEESEIEVSDHITVDEIAYYLNEDRIKLRRMIDHPISRKIIYDVIVEKGLQENILLEEYSLVFDNEYKEIKNDLIYSFEGIDLNSSAKQDFITIVKNSSIEGLLKSTKVYEKKDEVFVPGQKLIDKLSETQEVPVEIEISEDKNSVIYKYIGGKEEKEAVKTLIDLAKDAKILDEFIVDKDIKYLAQEQLLRDGINTKISVSDDFEYVPLNNKNKWLNANNIEKYENNKDLLDKIKKNYKIEDSISKYESIPMLFMHEKLYKQGYRAYQPINIAYGIKDTTVAKIEEKLVEYAGINISTEPVRYYPEGQMASHILGHLGKISQNSEIKEYVDEKGYSPNDIIGKTGVEESFEEYLRGESAIKKVEVDVFGNTTDIIDLKKSVPGDNVYLTIDSKLQKISEEALEKNLKTIQSGGVYDSEWGNYKVGINRKKGRPYSNATSGAVVAIDVKTGEVLSMASYPSYDPNLFATGISDTDWENLFPEDEKDPLAPRPLYNVATQTAVQPGSVFKMVTALAGLENGLDPNKYINGRGYVQIGDKTMGCWIWNQNRGMHGNENLYDALKDSCNYYFYSLALGKNQRTGQDIGVKVEIEDIVDLSKELGLDDKTGIEINIPTEYSGGVPNPQKKIELAEKGLEDYLNKNIKKYLKDDIIKTDAELEDMKNEIASWIEYETPLTRREVAMKLKDIEIDHVNIAPGDNKGITDVLKYDYINSSGWSMLDTLQITIGQGESAYTPIQMANYISTISNGGYKHDVSVIKNVKNYNNSKILFENEHKSDRIDLNNYENLDHIKRGMLDVTTSGTSRSIFNGFPVKVGAKTGTAQKSGKNPVTGDTYDGFAWFVAFAPYDEPEIAIATVIFQGGSGGYAGPLTRDIMAEYLGLNAVPTVDLSPYQSDLVQ